MTICWRVLGLGLLLLGPLGRAWAQEVAADGAARRYDALNVFRVVRYGFDPRYAYTTLPTAFRESDLATLPTDGAPIVRVDLVYTAYRLTRDFDQRQLNIDRLRRLEARLPGILTDPDISWNVMRQTGCADATTCAEYFHGFVLYREPRRTKAGARAEIDSLTARLGVLDSTLRREGMVVQTPVACYYPPLKFSAAATERRFRQQLRCPRRTRAVIPFRMQLDPKGRLLDVTVDDPAAGECAAAVRWALRQTLKWRNGFRVAGRAFPCEVRGEVRLPVRAGSLRIAAYVVPDSLIARYHIDLGLTDCVASRERIVLAQRPDDGIVGRVLRRNPKWQQRLIVADVTGSMYPYTADLLLWLRLALLDDEARTFVFFNDGDDKPDDAKPIGRTGGVYAVQSAEFAAVKETVLTAMRAGGGGDLPENNIEAVVAGLKLAPTAAEVILIADNYAFPRDTRLLNELRGVNLKIVLCGATPAINPRYLDLARQYRCSLHTVESDLTALHQLHRGERIVIDGITYLLDTAGFRVVSDL